MSSDYTDRVTKVVLESQLEEVTMAGWRLEQALYSRLSEGPYRYLVSRPRPDPEGDVTVNAAAANVLRAKVRELEDLVGREVVSRARLMEANARLQEERDGAYATRGEALRRADAIGDDVRALVAQMRAREPTYQAMLGLTRDLAEFNVHQGNVNDRISLRVARAVEIMKGVPA